MDQFFLTGEKLLLWRKKMLGIGGRAVDFDWLLDFGAGLNWSLLQMIRLYPKRNYKLLLSVKRLEGIWRLHLEKDLPLQHLLGRCPWRDFELESSPDALIPRQETELLIDFALKKIDYEHRGQWADLGTGSAPLAVALARELTFWQGHAVDISPQALDLAKKNLNNLAPFAKVKLYLGNWWEPLKEVWGDLNLVVSNPPYIPEKVLFNLDPIVKNHEPHLALYGGKDGMDSIKAIVSGALQGLAKGGLLILEHHHDQSTRILQLMNNLGLGDLGFEKDLEGTKRFAFGRKL